MKLETEFNQRAIELILENANEGDRLEYAKRLLKLYQREKERSQMLFESCKEWKSLAFRWRNFAAVLLIFLWITVIWF